MQNKLFLALSASSLLVLASCSSGLGELSADNFSASPTPLVTEAGKVPVTINGTFPEKYMKKNATVTVTPELRYGNAEATQAKGQTFQGEKVEGNNQTIFYKVGGRYVLKSSFTYKPAMQTSDLYVTFRAFVGDKQVVVPSVKVGYGVIATSELYKKTILSDGGVIAPDTFQQVSTQRQEANVKFLINQANLRKSELQTGSVKEFVNMLKKINQDRENLKLKNVEVEAYASPEGGFTVNDRLASARQDVSASYVKQQLKSANLNSDVDAHYTAQDWEGFKQLVEASNLQDKDVILRVLSMYKDPEEREQQIRNMSEGFRELADGILPQLRRARMTINYELVGHTDEEIKALYKENSTKLTLDETLYAATLTDDINEKEAIYKTAIHNYDKDYRAYNNMAALELAKGNTATAETYLTQALKMNKDASEPVANRGLISLLNGDIDTAEQDIAAASNATNAAYAVGCLNIAKGNYAQATSDLDKYTCNTTALAELLNKDYATAANTVANIKNPDGMTYYLKALINARQGNKSAARTALNDAISADSSLASYADADLELARIK